MTDWKEHPPQVQLTELRRRATQLASQLEAAASALQNTGQIPSAELATELEDLQRDFRALATQVEPEYVARDVIAWDDLARCIQRREQQLIVMPILRQTARLSHRSSAAFEPLLALQQFVAELRQRIDAGEASEDEIAPYLADDHGLAALIRLVREADNLTDEQWESLREAVERDLGRPLALAAVRNQLQLSDELGMSDAATGVAAPAEESGLAAESLYSADDPPGSPMPLADEEVESQSADSSTTLGAIPTMEIPSQIEPADAVSSIPFETDEESLHREDTVTVLGDTEVKFDISERRQLARIELPVELSAIATTAEDVALPRTMPSDESASSTTGVSADPVLAETDNPKQTRVVETAATVGIFARDRRSQALLVTPELQAMARLADQSTGAVRDRQLAELVWRLIFDGLSDIAWQLSRAAHQEETHTRVATSDIVRLWLIGHRITSADRELMQEYARIAESLANVADDHPIHQSNHPERTLAFAGLLRGAALIPDSSASQLLQRLAGDAETEVLGRYVSSVRRLAEHDTAFLRVRRMSENESDRSALSQHQLQDDISLWFESRSRDAVGFRRCEPLFVRPHWSVARGALQREPALTHTIGSWLHVQRLVHALLQPALDDDRGAVTDVRSLANRVQNKLVIGDAADDPPGSDKILVPRKDMADYLRQACDLAQRWVVRGRLDFDAASSPETHTPAALRQDLGRQQAELIKQLQAQALSNCNLPQQTAIGCLLMSVEQLSEAIQSNQGPAGGEWTIAELQTAHLRGLRICVWDQTGRPVCEDREFVDRVLLALAESPVQTSPDNEKRPSKGNSSGTPCDELNRSGSECEELAKTLQQALQEGLLSPHDHATFNARLLAMQCGDRIGGVSAERRVWLEDLERRLRTRGLVKSKGAIPSDEATARDLETQRSESVLLDD
ncbi:MAG: hypothetical protein ACK5Q5_17735 [Planctomycetaceae bacterium]